MRILATVTAAAALLLVACAQGPTRVTVNMEEWAIKLSQASAPAGDVTFVLRNQGKEEHELVILKTDTPDEKLAFRPADPNRAEEPGAIGEIEDVSSGKFKEATFTLAPGRYVLICNEPGHYKAGMHVAFIVR